MKWWQRQERALKNLFARENSESGGSASTSASAFGGGLSSSAESDQYTPLKSHADEPSALSSSSDDSDDSDDDRDFARLNSNSVWQLLIKHTFGNNYNFADDGDRRPVSSSS